MKTVLAKMGDTKEVLAFVSDVEANRSKYTIVSVGYSKMLDGPINRRLIRQALFAEKYSVVLQRSDEGAIKTLTLTEKDEHSPFVTEAVLLLVCEKGFEGCFADFGDDHGELFPPKIRLISRINLSEQLAPLGFLLEGKTHIGESEMFFFSRWPTHLKG